MTCALIDSIERRWKFTSGALSWHPDDKVSPEKEEEVMPELMGLKRIVVFNDEAHHCYRERQGAHAELEAELDALDTIDRKDARAEAEENNEAARIWISGLEIVQRKLGDARIFDLSATPFFLRGSGYAEGTLFPWTMSDFSLMPKFLDMTILQGKEGLNVKPL